MISRRTLLGAPAVLIASPVYASRSATEAIEWQQVANEARVLDQCHAIVVYRDGRQVLSEVFRGPAIDQAVPIKSVSKTIVAALAGMAIDRGEIANVKETLGELVPSLIPSGADSKVVNITIENLLTMQAGLQRTSGRNYGGWVSSRDWVSNALSRPMVAEPGTRMLYSTGSSHIMGAVLSEVSGKSLLALVRERIGKPLGIHFPAWTRDPQGRYLGGNEMALSIPGMIRFGELYRNGGRISGKQILSERWVMQSQIPVTQSVFSGLGYGYGWFLGDSGGTSYALARGYGGRLSVSYQTLNLRLLLHQTRHAWPEVQVTSEISCTL